MSTPADTRRKWYQEMAELFGRDVPDSDPRFNRYENILAYPHEAARLAAHFGRLAMQRDDESWVRLRFRQELWVNHGCEFFALYGDDGEMQCHACHVDFKREPLEELVQFVEFKRMKRVSDALAAKASLDEYRAIANAEEQDK